MLSHAQFAAAAGAAGREVTQASATTTVALPVVGVCCAVVALMLMWKRKAMRRTQAIFMLVTGLALGGVAGRARDWLTGLATSASASSTAKVFGVGVSYAMAIVIVLWFILDMDLDGLVQKMRKRNSGGFSGLKASTNKHRTTVLTPWLGLLVVPSVAVLPVVGALPGMFVAALG